MLCAQTCFPPAAPGDSAFGPLQADKASFCDKAGLQALPILTQIWEAAQVQTALHFWRPPPPVSLCSQNRHSASTPNSYLRSLSSR